MGSQTTPGSGLPDLDNRAPSLVNWIARDLDANVRQLLAASAGRGESIIADDTVRVVRDFNRNARWEQSWRLVDHTGLILKVTIQVLEEEQLTRARSCRKWRDRRWGPALDRPPIR